MKKYKWTVEFTIDATWVEDGFDLTQERAHDMITEALPHAYGHEVSAKIVKAPEQKEILEEQGYTPEAIRKWNKKQAIIS